MTCETGWESFWGQLRHLTFASPILYPGHRALSQGLPPPRTRSPPSPLPYSTPFYPSFFDSSSSSSSPSANTGVGWFARHAAARPSPQRLRKSTQRIPHKNSCRAQPHHPFDNPISHSSNSLKKKTPVRTSSPLRILLCQVRVLQKGLARLQTQQCQQPPLANEPQQPEKSQKQDRSAPLIVAICRKRALRRKRTRMPSPAHTPTQAQRPTSRSSSMHDIAQRQPSATERQRLECKHVHLDRVSCP